MERTAYSEFSKKSKIKDQVTPTPYFTPLDSTVSLSMVLATKTEIGREATAIMATSSSHPGTGSPKKPIHRITLSYLIRTKRASNTGNVLPQNLWYRWFVSKEG